MESGTFDTAAFADELEAAEENREVATTLLLENDRVRIWDLTLEPGERAPFHCHAVPYFFVCVAGGEAVTRFPNGHLVEMTYRDGDTWFTDLEHGPEVHDLENVGDTTLRFTTVELVA